jgi:zinc transport system ATP-binding protein
MTDIAAPTRNPETSLGDTALRVVDLTVRLDGRTVLQAVTFDVRRGTTLAVLGPNGAGKTVLLRTLLGLIPHEGTISWREGAKVGYVPQSLFVADVPITVREFLDIKRGVDVRGALASVGLEPDSIMEERLGTLSGGELQRVLIAWAIADRPDVLLFDEPLSNVDLGGEDLILETLNRIEKAFGITVLLVSHDVHNVIEYSDSALALNRTVVYFGPSKNLSDPALLARIYGSGTLLSKHAH